MKYEPNFAECPTIDRRKGGMKVAVLGYTNAANASLMDDSCVSGISFESLLPLVHMKAGGKPSGLPPVL